MAEAAAAGRTSCADSEVDSEVDSAGASLGRRPVATTATAALAALRGKKNPAYFSGLFSSKEKFVFGEKYCEKILK